MRTELIAGDGSPLAINARAAVLAPALVAVRSNARLDVDSILLVVVQLAMLGV